MNAFELDGTMTEPPMPPLDAKLVAIVGPQKPPAVTWDIIKAERVRRVRALWNTIEKLLEEPVRKVYNDYSGYTNTRAVLYGDEEETYALGFQLHTVKYDNSSVEDTISAYLVKMYPEDARLLEVEKEEYHVSIVNPGKNPQDLEFLEMLLELYENAPSE